MNTSYLTIFWKWNCIKLIEISPPDPLKNNFWIFGGDHEWYSRRRRDSGVDTKNLILVSKKTSSFQVHVYIDGVTFWPPHGRVEKNEKPLFIAPWHQWHVEKQRNRSLKCGKSYINWLNRPPDFFLSITEF